MRRFTFLAVGTIAASLAGCATTMRSATQSAGVAPGDTTISYEVGPCFGFCPVYAASISPDGKASFDGTRHTATLGHQTADPGIAAYRAFARDLAPYKPALGTTASTSCDTRISDQQQYRITWSSSDGSKTVLEHDRGCRSARNDGLNAILQAAPDRIGIGAFAKQLTREGTPRG